MSSSPPAQQQGTDHVEQQVYMSYKIAMLADPDDEMMELLCSISYERVLEILLIMRESSRPIRTPLNFVRRAIAEGWSTSTQPQQVNRRLENHTKRIYMQRGMTADAAQARVMHERNRDIFSEMKGW